MNITIKLSALLATTFVLTMGCGDKKAPEAAPAATEAAATAAPAEPAAPAAPVEPAKPIAMTAALDVGAAVKDADETRYAGMKMTGPEGSTVEDSGMGLTVKWGELQFEFRFAFDDENAVAEAKTKAGEDTLDKLVKLHIDTPEAVLWEAKSVLSDDGPNNFSFVAAVKVGEKTLICKNKGYGQFSQAEAEALLKTCQSATL